MLSRQLSESVPVRIRSRGGGYFRAGRVTLQKVADDEVVAKVAGTRDYEVLLEADVPSGLVWCSCSCRYFEDRDEVCKHVWALVLACEKEGLLEVVATFPSVALETLPPMHLEDEPPVAGAGSEWAGSGLGSGSAPASRWRNRLRDVESAAFSRSQSEMSWPEERQILYRIEVERRYGNPVVELRCRDRMEDGTWGPIRQQSPRLDSLSRLPDAADRTLLAMVAGAEDLGDGHYVAFGGAQVTQRFTLPAAMQPAWLRMAAETGRLSLDGDETEDRPLTWDDGERWQLELEVRAGKEWDGWVLEGFLIRDQERRHLSAAVLLSAAGLVFWSDSVARLDDGGAFSWVRAFGRRGTLRIPRAEIGDFLSMALSLPRPPSFRLPPELTFEEVRAAPMPGVRISEQQARWRTHVPFWVELGFEYGGHWVDRGDPRSSVYLPAESQLHFRDPEAERIAADRLRQLGVRSGTRHGYYRDAETGLIVSKGKLDKLLRELTAEGWSVRLDGRAYRRPGELLLEVSSGIDWFELQGSADFDGAGVAFPKLLRALQRGDETVDLDDGGVGWLPPDWRERYGRFAELGVLEEDHLRFGHHQVGLVDGLLATRPEIGFDRTVARARGRLAGFSGIRPCREPRGFRGELRDYQREGLAWLHFLREFGFGGCLADDMGLGKTVQALALLEARRVERRAAEEKGESWPPTLIVVPKSLVVNWHREAARFTPGLRVVEHMGPGRAKDLEALAPFDLVLTTYGTLRRDIGMLSKREFDYVILDEAQAIKNGVSATARAARQLRARHRLALSGTPIENHVGELLSLFEFLNPGLFGHRGLKIPTKSVQRSVTAAEDPTLQLIAATVQPFILRRTKDKVAPELPEKIEEKLFCELPPRQRREYDQLRAYYRDAIMGRIEQRGLGRSKLLVLEALLRLRQAACHPGLLDVERRGEGSAKLDLLLERCDEVLEGDSKALVFSQFTSLLSIVRQRLDERGVTYAYLDGKTRKRQERVDRFQTDPDCRLFLISLRAGGLGLNLTAAEYVFLLDPWWNPAVEAQAIDRTHRIGQSRHVFAFSLIARDTVEEKVLELQRSKKALAEAIITADRGLISKLDKDDLALLLS